jgi:DNA-directed RNA polymerase specialized sigma24 family protein
MTLNDPADTRRAAFLRAFAALSNAVLKRIARYAKERSAFLEQDAQDLINDAVVRFVKGDRQWSPETLEKDFIRAIRSISWNLYVSQRSRKDRELRFSESPTDPPSLEDRIDHVQRVKRVLEHFDEHHDEDAAKLIRAMLKHSSAKLAAESLGFTPERSEAVLRRIRRRMRGPWSKKK